MASETQPHLHCPHCGYDLTGLPDERCPECGRAYDVNELMAERMPKPPEPVRIMDLVGFLAIPFVAWLGAISEPHLGLIRYLGLGGTMFVTLFAALWVSHRISKRLLVGAGRMMELVRFGLALFLVFCEYVMILIALHTVLPFH